LNAFSPIRDNFDPDSNAIEESDMHSEKHPKPKISTDAGIMIIFKPVPRNTCFSIRDNFDPDSNVIDKSDRHEKKHFSPKNITESGILRNLRPAFRNASLSIRSNFDLISITTDSIDLFPLKLCNELILCDEGSHSLLQMKSEWGIVETH
jgi:hypothetical protein